MKSGETEFRVRYNECDPMGVAHHTAYPVWFEVGRTELLRADGISYRELEAEGVMLAVVSLEVKYRRPARYDDLLRLRTTLAQSGHVKIEHTYELFRDRPAGSAELLATGRTVLACLDRSGRLQAIPPVLAVES